MLDDYEDPKCDEPEPKRRRKLSQTVARRSEGLEAFGDNFKAVGMGILDLQNKQLEF